MQHLFEGLSFHDVVTWKKPVASAVALCFPLTIFAIFHVADYSLTTFICRILQGAMIFHLVAPRVGHTFPPPEKYREVVEAGIEKFKAIAGCMTTSLVSVLDWQNTTCSASVFGFLLVFAMLGNVLGDGWVFISTTVALFTLPLVYSKNKTQIDHHISQLQQKLNSFQPKASAHKGEHTS